MTVTNAYTLTSTFTRTGVVLMQYQVALEYAGVLSEERIGDVLWAIGEQALSSLSVYACDDKGKRVAEVEITIDWAEHAQQISLYGDAFDMPAGGFNPNSGALSETTVFVTALVKSATEAGYRIGVAVRATNGLPKEKWLEVCKRCGIAGTIPEWAGDLAFDQAQKYGALPQMQIAARSVNQ